MTDPPETPPNAPPSTPSTGTWLTSSSARTADAVRQIQSGLRTLVRRFDRDDVQPTRLFDDPPPLAGGGYWPARQIDSLPPTLGEMYRHSDSHIWPDSLRPELQKDVSNPLNYQWYLQQVAQNRADKLYSTQMNIREANEHGGAPLGNDILHGSRVVNLPKQRTDGVYIPIRQAAIDQGILRPTNRWRQKLNVPHKQRMVAQQSRADLMCLQRWKTQGPDYPVMLGINPNIAPLTVRRNRVRGGYKSFQVTKERNIFGPY